MFTYLQTENHRIYFNKALCHDKCPCTGGFTTIDHMYLKMEDFSWTNSVDTDQYVPSEQSNQRVHILSYFLWKRVFTPPTGAYCFLLVHPSKQMFF